MLISTPAETLHQRRAPNPDEAGPDPRIGGIGRVEVLSVANGASWGSGRRPCAVTQGSGKEVSFQFATVEQKA